MREQPTLNRLERGIHMPDDNTPAPEGDEGKTSDEGKQEFRSPKDQAEFDSMVAGRLARERGKFADYDALREKASKFDELAEKNKTESEKLTDKLTATEQRALAAELNAARMEVAVELGLNPSQAKRLVGNNKDELLADAKTSIEDGTFKVAEGPRRPNPNPDQGKTSTEKSDPDAWLRDLARK